MVSFARVGGRWGAVSTVRLHVRRVGCRAEDSGCYAGRWIDSGSSQCAADLHPACQRAAPARSGWWGRSWGTGRDFGACLETSRFTNNRCGTTSFRLNSQGWLQPKLSPGITATQRHQLLGEPAHVRTGWKQRDEQLQPRRGASAARTAADSGARGRAVARRR